MHLHTLFCAWIWNFNIWPVLRTWIPTPGAPSAPWSCRHETNSPSPTSCLLLLFGAGQLAHRRRHPGPVPTVFEGGATEECSLHANHLTKVNYHLKRSRNVVKQQPTHSESESLGGGERKETRKKYGSTIPWTWGELSTAWGNCGDPIPSHISGQSRRK